MLKSRRWRLKTELALTTAAKVRGLAEGAYQPRSCLSTPPLHGPSLNSSSKSGLKSTTPLSSIGRHHYALRPHRIERSPSIAAGARVTHGCHTSLSGTVVRRKPLEHAPPRQPSQPERPGACCCIAAIRRLDACQSVPRAARRATVRGRERLASFRAIALVFEPHQGGIEACLAAQIPSRLAIYLDTGFHAVGRGEVAGVIGGIAKFIGEPRRDVGSVAWTGRSQRIAGSCEACLRYNSPGGRRIRVMVMAN